MPAIRTGATFNVVEIEAAADVVVWAATRCRASAATRPQDTTFVGNIVEAMIAYADGKLGEQPIHLDDVDRIIAIGSDRNDGGSRRRAHTVLAPYLKPSHARSARSTRPMQCMMKEVCAQCLQRHVDPRDGGGVASSSSCFNQDQPLDVVDFPGLSARLAQNSVQERLDGAVDRAVPETRRIAGPQERKLQRGSSADMDLASHRPRRPWIGPTGCRARITSTSDCVRG